MTTPDLQPEPFGQRIARLRALRGWTQSDLAERLAASRVAVSHFEAGLAVPSERTVVLLAGLFGLEPHELVDSSSYPPGKADRLPLVACRHTEVDLQLALLRRDMVWIERLAGAPALDALAEEVRACWRGRLAELEAAAADLRERGKVRRARAALEQPEAGLTSAAE